MSEVDFRTRADVQQQDIGPIFNYETIASYEWLAANYQRDFESESSRELLWRLIRDASHYIAERYETIVQPTETGRLLEGSTGNIMVTPRQLFIEGAVSGLVMPMKTMCERESDSGTGYLGGFSGYYDEIDQLSIERKIEILESKQFQATLLQISNAPNGTYGEASSASIGRSPFRKLTKHAAFDGDCLSDEFKGSLENRWVVRGEYRFSDSMGCPVRKRSYPNLGPIALTYCEEFDVNPAELRYPEKSAIVVGCEVLAHCLQVEAAAKI